LNVFPFLTTGRLFSLGRRITKKCRSASEGDAMQHKTGNCATHEEELQNISLRGNPFYCVVSELLAVRHCTNQPIA
jgi:hypothetical protein